MQRRQLELKAMTALVGPKDKYTGMLLTAVPYGRKTEILLNQIEGLAGWAWTKMSLVKELCNFCVCVNVEMSNHIKILFFFHNWSYLALNIDCVFLCLLPFWELKDLKPEPGQYHPTCAIWDFFFPVLYCHYLHCHCLQPVTFTNAGVFFSIASDHILKATTALGSVF